MCSISIPWLIDCFHFNCYNLHKTGHPPCCMSAHRAATRTIPNSSPFLPIFAFGCALANCCLWCHWKFDCGQRCRRLWWIGSGRHQWAVGRNHDGIGKGDWPSAIASFFAATDFVIVTVIQKKLLHSLLNDDFCYDGVFGGFEWWWYG